MGKSAELLIKRLKAVIDRGDMKKADVKRATGFSSSLLETYLKGESVPGMDAMDRIAEALGMQPADAIRPDDSSIPAIKRQFIQEILQLDDTVAEVIIPNLRPLLEGALKLYRNHDLKKLHQK